MGSAFAAVQVACTTIKVWLKAGLKLASDTMKWVWKQAGSMLEVACELARDFFRQFNACFRYHRQRTSVEVNDNRVEVRH